MTLDRTMAIQARDVTKVFGTGDLAFTALRGVDLDVGTGELALLVGPSGSGKTTLLSILGAVLSATSGSVSLLGRELTGLSRNQLARVRLEQLGFVFQGHNLIRALSALDNVALPLELRGWSRRRARQQAAQMLEQVGLADKADSLPTQLSGGQAQRVAIARALAPHPPILLADEPTAALDAATGRSATELMKDLTQELGTTALVVTHDERIFDLADRIVHIEDGWIEPSEGRLAA